MAAVCTRDYGVATQAQDFKAGAGKSDIQTSSDMWPVDGFTSQHDSLAVRVVDGRWQDSHGDCRD